MISQSLYFATVAGLALILCEAGAARADVFADPPHSHAPSPVTTNGAGPDAQHQHRTNHPVGQGVKIHSTGAGAAAYKANGSWIGRTYHKTLTGHTEFGHGHVHRPVRYHIHDGFPDSNAEERIDEAFVAWMAAANAAGSNNWPDSEDDVPPPPTGVPWHSMLQFEKVTESSAKHEIHIEFTNEGLDDDDWASWFSGTHGPDSHAQSLHIRTDPETIVGGDGWAWDLALTEDHHYDFATTILHEVGHIVGFDHFGSFAAKQIMRRGPPPFRDGHFSTSDTKSVPQGSGRLRTIDEDARHGAEDLYAIAESFGCGDHKSVARLAGTDVLCFDQDSYFTLDGLSFTTLGLGPDLGIQIGAAQSASGGHSGVPDYHSDFPGVDQPWEFLGNTGMHFTVGEGIDFVEDGHTDHRHLDFSNWRMAWGDIGEINLGGNPLNFPTDMGLALMTCTDDLGSVTGCNDGDSFVLDYAAHVPLGELIGFDGAPYSLHLEGLFIVPEPASVLLFTSGLIGLIGFSRSRGGKKPKPSDSISIRSCRAAPQTRLLLARPEPD